MVVEKQVQDVKNQNQIRYSQLWTEKYRPKKIDDVFLDEEIKKVIKQKIKSGDLPNLLLIGEAGTGKTSLANAIVNELNAEVLILNASKDRGIDVIRNKVAKFAKIATKKPKIVFFDEADGLTPDAQQALRNLMEEYSDTTRFIFTANYEHGIIEPIKDRCMVIKFKRIPKEFFKGVLEKIISNEKIYIAPDNTEETKENVINKIIDYSYPSLRSAVETLQTYSFDIDGYIDELELDLETAKTDKQKKYLENLIKKLKELKEKEGYKYYLQLPKDLITSKDKKNIGANINLLTDKLLVQIYDKENTPIYVIRRTLIENNINNFAPLYKNIFEKLILLLENYDKKDLENDVKDTEIRELLKEIRDRLNISKEQLEQDLLLLSEYQYRDRQSVDKEVNFFGFILAVRNRTFPYVLAQFVKDKYYSDYEQFTKYNNQVKNNESNNNTIELQRENEKIETEETKEEYKQISQNVLIQNQNKDKTQEQIQTPNLVNDNKISKQKSNKSVVNPFSGLGNSKSTKGKTNFKFPSVLKQKRQRNNNITSSSNTQNLLENNQVQKHNQNLHTNNFNNNDIANVEIEKENKESKNKENSQNQINTTNTNTTNNSNNVIKRPSSKLRSLRDKLRKLREQQNQKQTQQTNQNNSDNFNNTNTNMNIHNQLENNFSQNITNNSGNNPLGDNKDLDLKDEELNKGLDDMFNFLDD